MSVVIGYTTARAVWLALENTFSHQSKARELLLKGQLQSVKKDDRLVTEFGHEFKLLWDQLSKIGSSVDTQIKFICF